MELLAPAKVNLFLEIIGKRADGYHEIDTILQTINLYDKISISNRDQEIVFKCNWLRPEDIVPDEEDNIAYRAAILLKEQLNEKKGAKIVIKKNIPVGAGLGGGSSDAVCVIRGLLKLWHRKIERKDLEKLTLKLGVDVPFFLHQGCCFAKGIGEKLTPVRTSWSKKPLCLVLVNPGVPVPTKMAYRLLPDRFTDRHVIDKIKSPLTETVLKSIAFNRFEEVVFRHYPGLKEIKQSLIKVGAELALMSGSGSTIFGIFNTEKDAMSAYREIKRMIPEEYKIILSETI